MHVVVVGGGIAGLSAAFHLAGSAEVTLVEREPVVAAHSSGRNAAIFRHLEGGTGAVPLAVRASALLDALLPGWKRPTGALYVAHEPGEVEHLEDLGRRHEVAHRRADGTAAERVPALAGGVCDRVLDVPGDGVIDIHGVTTALARGAARRGAVVRTGLGAERVLAEGGRVRGVVLESGERLDADVVVNAAGAWAEGLGATCGAPLPLDPRRRHLVILDPEARPDAEAPVVWRVDEGIYVRPESGGVLASPCDEASWAPGIPPTDPEALVRLGERMGRFAPVLASASVRRAWACLRTFAPDRDPVIGADPRLTGLFWIAGLGGRGMTVGLAAGDLLAAAVAGRTDPLLADLAPARLLA